MSIDQTVAGETNAHTCGCGGGCGGGGGGGSAARSQADAAAEQATGGARRDLGLVAARPGASQLEAEESYATASEASAPHAASAPAPASVTAGSGDLDARAIPREVRRAALTAAVGALPPGRPLVIAADHDPAHLPVLLTAALGRPVRMSYLAQGPQLWRVQVVTEAG